MSRAPTRVGSRVALSGFNENSHYLFCQFVCLSETPSGSSCVLKRFRSCPALFSPSNAHSLDIAILPQLLYQNTALSQVLVCVCVLKHVYESFSSVFLCCLFKLSMLCVLRHIRVSPHYCALCTGNTLLPSCSCSWLTPGSMALLNNKSLHARFSPPPCLPAVSPACPAADYDCLRFFVATRIDFSFCRTGPI